MRYCFLCSACGSTQEWIGPCAEKPEDLACDCGQRKTQVLGNFSVVVKHEQRVVTNAELADAAWARARKYTNSAAGKARKKREVKAVNTMRSLAEEQQRSGSKSQGIGRLVASMPVRYVQEHNIDRGQGWLSNQDPEQTKSQLKQDGLWFGK